MFHLTDSPCNESIRGSAVFGVWIWASHCFIIAEKFRKSDNTRFSVTQLSPRGGTEFWQPLYVCVHVWNSVYICNMSVLYMFWLVCLYSFSWGIHVAAVSVVRPWRASLPVRRSWESDGVSVFSDMLETCFPWSFLFLGSW